MPKQPIYARINRVVYPQESVSITLGSPGVVRAGVKVVPCKRIRLACGEVEQKDNLLKIRITNEDEALVLKQGSIVGYHSKTCRVDGVIKENTPSSNDQRGDITVWFGKVFILLVALIKLVRLPLALSVSAEFKDIWTLPK